MVPAASDHDLDTIARTIWGEARGELYGGKVAVGCVIRNRVEARRQHFGQGWVGVCTKKWQFSCWLENDPNRAKLLAVTTDDEAFRSSLQIARLIVDGVLPDVTFGSCHYHTEAMGWPGSWGDRRTPVIQIGAHLFYNDVA